ncbi:helix-turn-helix domain-containing protein [Alkalibaculum sp. M08DMB]|uniref:Helix-turn-helix domain-containing protein n=1 Tax=Alkalibaculum sporogenes TaxID=2655001 RepID=A0A6A7KAW2_9FIRM|nr:Crp/Fnr family transcriptional regulator [Alkalibaculum sporogenes]MPW26495.1 helix-turn-helix domain-containing protein [Alkalibaculum sporogenes]
MIQDDNISILSQVLTFWDKLESKDKNLIVDHTINTTYQQGNFYSGENDCIGILIIKSGSFRIYLLSEDGREITLFRLEKGDICVLSATCIFENITFDVNLSAEVESEVLLINPKVFSKIASKNIYAENFLYKEAAKRFSDVMWTMDQILFMKFDKRLALFLLNEISRNNSNIVYLTHDQIAKHLSSAREVVSRMLSYFAKEGLIKLSRGEITIVNETGLEKFS